MAGIKDSFSKGLATLNVKTSNFMEENKMKTHIATLESEIQKLKCNIGEIVYQRWAEEIFELQDVCVELESIKEKYALIETIKGQIEELSLKERQILGSGDGKRENGERYFCPNCGAEYKSGYSFCERCGNRLE